MNDHLTESVPRANRRTWQFSRDVRLLGAAAVVGPKEGNGPLGAYMDHVYEDLYAGEETWEKAERRMMRDAVERAIEKAGLSAGEVDLMLAGDLLNQNITATFTAEEMNIPFIGMYGACSTSMLTLAHAAALVDAGYARTAVAACSSHNATAERQYRYPTEYGGQKPPTAQWTVSGAGAAVVGTGGDGPRLTHATMGRVIDLGVKDPFDMGTAMAPAAVDTLEAHFRDTGRTPADYDLIVTGDLAGVGFPIAKEMLAERGYDMEPVYNDCGLMIFSPDQEVFAGGSGCACSAVVTYGYIVGQMMLGRLKRVLVCATGALLSPVSYLQGESIPCVAHAVALEGGKS